MADYEAGIAALKAERTQLARKIAELDRRIKKIKQESNRLVQGAKRIGKLLGNQGK